MSDKTIAVYSALTYAWVFALAVLGGLVSYIRKVRMGQARPFNFVELIGELVTSGFVGLLTFWLCQEAGVSANLTAFFVATSGHMGARALFMLERFAESRLPIKLGYADQAKTGEESKRSDKP